MKRFRMHRAVRAFIYSLLSVIASYIFLFPEHMGQAEHAQGIFLQVLSLYTSTIVVGMNGVSTYATMLFVPLYYWYYVFLGSGLLVTKQMKKLSHFIAFLLFFGLYPLTLGEMFVSKLFSIHIFLEIPVYLGIYFMVKSILVRLFYFWDDMARRIPASAMKHSSPRYFFCMFGIILLAWAPFVLLQFPGSVGADTMAQIKEHVIDRHYDAANPLFLTLLYGNLFSLGSIWSDNMGIFLGILLQNLALAASFAYVLLRVRQMHLPKAVSHIMLFFYAFTPVWSTFVHSLLKDVAHTAAFAFFAVEFLDMIRRKKIDKWLIFRFSLSCLLMVLTRVTGLYILLPCLIVLAVYHYKVLHKKLCLGIVGIALAAALINPALMLVLRAEKRGMADNLGWMFQMTAHYARVHRDTITQEEIDTINLVLNYDVIVEKYSPTLSDPVKATFSFVQRSDFIRYFQLWVRQFFKDPNAYITSFLNGGYNYWNPVYDYRFVPRDTISIDFPTTLDFVFPQELRNVSGQILDIWRNLPPFGWLFKGSTYAYLLFVCYAYAGHRKKKQARLLMLPMLLLLIGCMFSPVSGDFRYMAPYVAVLPLALAYTIEYPENKAEEEILQDVNEKTGYESGLLDTMPK